MSSAFWLWAPLVVAVSSTPHYTERRHPDDTTFYSNAPGSPEIIYGETQTSRTIYTVVSLVCLSLLTGMLGYRARQLERLHIRNLNLTRILVLILYFLAISFVIAAAVVESGLGLSSASICQAAILICLAFYLGSKVTMYVFLVERAHALRAPYMRRSADWIWLLGMLSIAGGFGSIAICSFLWPIADLSTKDGRCRVGLPLKVTIPLLTFDIIMNTALTGTFIYLLKPLLRFGGIPHSNALTSRFTQGLRKMLKANEQSLSSDVYPMNQTFLKSIEALLWKTLIGSVLVMLPTVGNIAALYTLKGQELGWLCLTVCTFDVTWAVCVIHWLTVGSPDVDERTLVMLAQESASDTSTRPSGSL